MKITMNLLLMLLFFIMNIMLIFIKLLSEKDMTQRKADFLNCMGMRKKDRISYMKKEIIYYFHFLPLIISVLVAAAFTGAVFFARQYDVTDMFHYLKYMIPVWSIYVAGSSILLWIIITTYIHRLEER